ncbi:MAG: oligopeptide transporter substrate-binding protein, partial [Firmicutes bacterium]|nr:oligopeptide transporter substrate-binding protein [Bacillota bacterium]
MKRYLVLLLSVLCVMCSAMPGSAARPDVRFSVTFNGHPVRFDVQPEVVPPGHTMVPLRAIAEKMGAQVTYDAATQTVTARRGSTTISLTIGRTTATINGREQSLPLAPYIKDGRTLIPLRFISETLGAAVKFDPATSAIAIVDSTWPRRGGDLNLALPHKPEGPLNPIITNDAYGNDLIGMIYDGLWRYDDRLMPVPALAESWAWSEDDTKLTFYIRKGVRFFDGTELTADDVLFTFKAIAHPQYSGALNAGYDGVLGWTDYHNAIRGESAADFAAGKVTTAALAGLYAADRYIVVFKLSKADGPFFFRNTGTGILDHSKYQAIPVQDWGTARDPYNAKPNGTGAFRMDQYQDGELAILKANEHYWAGRPYVDRVIFRVVTADVAVSELQSGKLDVAEFGAGNSDAYQVMNNVTVHQLKDAVFQSMGMNTARGITSDLAVRQAISYGIDR